MRILLVNDDGFYAPGFGVLRQIAAELSDDVWAVAPESDQSGMGHSLTLSHPLRVREVDERSFVLRGTPTDCVTMGVRQLMPEPPDLVLSGVNMGQNAANDVTYSGTAAGAMEGAILGIPSIALSQRVDWAGDGKIHWETALAHGPDLINRLLRAKFSVGTFINVNFPDRIPEEVEGVDVVPQGLVDHELGAEKRRDGRGQPYYWLTFKSGALISEFHNDVSALRAGRIAVTPMRPDFTDHAALTPLRHALERG